MVEPKKIYCPRCGRKTMVYDGRSTINPIAKCRKCKKLVIYDIEKDSVTMKDMPKRDCSSGMRFY